MYYENIARPACTYCYTVCINYGVFIINMYIQSYVSNNGYICLWNKNAYICNDQHTYIATYLHDLYICSYF